MKLEDMLLEYLSTPLIQAGFVKSGNQSFLYRDEEDVIFVYIEHMRATVITDGTNVNSQITTFPITFNLNRMNFEEFLQFILNSF